MENNIIKNIETLIQESLNGYSLFLEETMTKQEVGEFLGKTSSIMNYEKKPHEQLVIALNGKKIHIDEFIHGPDRDRLINALDDGLMFRVDNNIIDQFIDYTNPTLNESSIKGLLDLVHLGEGWSRTQLLNYIIYNVLEKNGIDIKSINHPNAQEFASGNYSWRYHDLPTNELTRVNNEMIDEITKAREEIERNKSIDIETISQTTQEIPLPNDTSTSSSEDILSTFDFIPNWIHDNIDVSHIEALKIGGLIGLFGIVGVTSGYVGTKIFKWLYERYGNGVRKQLKIKYDIDIIIGANILELIYNTWEKPEIRKKFKNNYREYINNLYTRYEFTINVLKNNSRKRVLFNDIASGEFVILTNKLMNDFKLRSKPSESEISNILNKKINKSEFYKKFSNF